MAEFLQPRYRSVVYRCVAKEKLNLLKFSACEMA